jgi:hypothetical protein
MPKIATLALSAMAMVAATIALPATAHAESDEFQSPSGNVYCLMDVTNGGRGSVYCQGGGPYAVPTPANCHLAWGERFSLDQGSAPVSHCHGDTIVPPYGSPGKNPAVPTLDSGQTRSAGTITCASEPTGMKCTDSSTGHYFRMSEESNQLG